MKLLRRFYKFFIGHRVEYTIGFAALFFLLGWFARSVATGWLVVMAFWLYVLPYVLYLIGAKSNWDADIAEEVEKGN